MSPLSILIGMLTRIFPASIAHAQISNAIQTVGAGGSGLGPLLTGFSGLGFGANTPEGIAGAIVVVVWSVVLPIAVFMVVRAGFSLIISQEEDKLSRAKRTITSTLISIMLIYISQELVKGFYTLGIAGGGQTVLQQTIYGLVNWWLVTMAALGVLMIVISVIRGISSFGKEEGVTNMRHTVVGVATGIIMVSLLPAVKATLGIVDLAPLGAGTGGSNASAIIGAGSRIVGNLLLFLALIAVTVVIYAGIRMIVNFGNDEEYNKSRSLITRALIGLVVILLSYTFVQFLLTTIGAR